MIVACLLGHMLFERLIAVFELKRQLLEARLLFLCHRRQSDMPGKMFDVARWTFVGPIVLARMHLLWHHDVLIAVQYLCDSSWMPQCNSTLMHTMTST